MTTLIKPKVVAIGGAGIKIATRLKAECLAEYDILGIDLAQTAAPFEVFSLGSGSTLEIFGSGGDPEVAKRAAENKLQELEMKLQNSNLLFIICGLGGGTASAVAPIVSECAKKLGAFTLCFSTLPFGIEGSRRTAQAKESLANLRSTGSVVVTLPNDVLLRCAPSGSSAAQAMEIADKYIGKAIRSFTSMACTPGLIDVDFESLKKTFIGRNGKTLFSHGEGFGSQAVTQIFSELTACPLLHCGDVAKYADHLLISVKVSKDIGLKEINLLTSQLAEKFGTKGEKIIGASIDTNWTDSRIEVLLIGQPDPEIRKKQNAAIQAAAQAAKAVRQKIAPEVSPQTEFGFNSLQDHRGFFENTDPNVYRGEDVDIPTYLRRGVKVIL